MTAAPSPVARAAVRVPAVAAPVRLIDGRGEVRVGIFDGPVDEVNHADYVLATPFGRRVGGLARRFAYKQFEFLGGLCDRLVFGCAVADFKYVGTAFLYCYDPATRQMSEASIKRPLARGVRFDEFPERGSTVLEAGGDRIEMSALGNGAGRRLAVRLARGVRIEATFDERTPAMEPMRLCTRAGATGWVYARKTAGFAVSGELVWGERRFDLAALGLRGHRDWSAGFMRRDTFWNWGCIAGRLADGRSVGLNVSCGVNETSFTESCFWLDGTLHKLDAVSFEYDRRDLMRPWSMTSYDGRMRLEFEPEGRHTERVNAAIVATNFHQLFGRYRGHLATAEGERIVIDGLLGYAESHYARW